MFTPVILKTENELNKILKTNKRTGVELRILFVSTWDKWCNDLVNRLRAVATDDGIPLYVVDSFSMPHAFVIFNTTKLPHLVKLKREKVRSEDYLPRVYKDLGL